MFNMFNSLYENIGTKIKYLAIGTFIVETIGAIITGLILAFSEDILFIFIAIGGPVAALIFSWFIYAFGELVEDVHNMNNNSKDKQPQKNVKIQASNKPKQSPAKKVTAKKAKISVDQKDENNTAGTLKLTQRGDGYICPTCGTANYSFSPCKRCYYVPIETSEIKNEHSETEYSDISCPNCGELISVLDEKNLVCPWCNVKIDLS